jgi:hypothetical protein
LFSGLKDGWINKYLGNACKKLVKDKRIPQQSLFWLSTGKRTSGRPRETLRRSIIRERLSHVSIEYFRNETFGNGTRRLESYGFCPNGLIGGT